MFWGASPNSQAPLTAFQRPLTRFAGAGRRRDFAPRQFKFGRVIQVFGMRCPEITGLQDSFAGLKAGIVEQIGEVLRHRHLTIGMVAFISQLHNDMRKKWNGYQ